MAATAIWVWNEPVNASLDGSIYLRPANAWAAGQAMLDVNRLGDEVRSIATAKAPVAILYSVPSALWQPDYEPALMSLYASLSMLGHPVTFISERQLADGRRSKANADIDMIALPRATHVKGATLNALEDFVGEGGRLLALGQDNLRYDEYGRSHGSSPALVGNTQTIDWTRGEYSDADLFNALAGTLVLEEPEAFPIISEVSGERVFGVPYRVVRNGDTLLVSLINMKASSEIVSLPVTGNCEDILNAEIVDAGRIVLEPMKPRLLRVNVAN